MNFQLIARAIRGLDRFPETFRCRAQIERWLPVTLQYVGLADPPFPYRMRFHNGLELEMCEMEDLKTIWQIAFRKVYKLRPEDRYIVDCGANVGLFACYAAKAHPELQIHAIEPYPPNLERLRTAIAENALSERIRICPWALAGEEGSVSMWSGDFPSQMARIFPGERSNKVDVRAVPLEKALEDSGFPRIDLLKIDIEGSEFAVFDSTPPEVLRNVGRIDVEYHCPIGGDNRTWGELVDKAGAAGFKPVSTDGLDPDYDVLHFERD